MGRYRARAGFLTINDATDMMVKSSGGSEDRDYCYRLFLRLAKEGKLRSQKNGRAWWLFEDEVQGYIKKVYPDGWRGSQGSPERGEIVAGEKVLEMINLLEKAETPPEKIIEVIKEKIKESLEI